MSAFAVAEIPGAGLVWVRFSVWANRCCQDSQGTSREQGRITSCAQPSRGRSALPAEPWAPGLGSANAWSLLMSTPSVPIPFLQHTSRTPQHSLTGLSRLSRYPSVPSPGCAAQAPPKEPVCIPSGTGKAENRAESGGNSLPGSSLVAQTELQSLGAPELAPHGNPTYPPASHCCSLGGT